MIWKNVSGVGKVCKQCFLKKCATKPTAKKRTPIPARSSKRIELDKEYSVLRKKFLDENPMCQAHLDNCTQIATEIHHRAGKVGELYCDVNNFMAICRTCHTWCTEFSKEAIELGLSNKRN